MIELQDVSKIYTMGQVEVKALDQVNLKIERGEFISIIGPSGSGKSTLLTILGVLDLPTEGEYLLEGTDITDLDDRELSRIRNQHFGFVFQSYNLFPELTAQENVAVPLMYARVSPKERAKRALELLEMVEMGHRAKHYPSQLSGGEQQRVALARALANNPTLLLADEPTGNLSSKHEDEILALFNHLNSEKDVTIALVTHSPKVAGYGSRLVTMADGQILSDAPIERRYEPVDYQTESTSRMAVGGGKEA
ncbi:MAG TPA: ABC transporter ATP-binding protein [Firmicutes bacterium]|jgi:putative ABC transport system ATP-binding protein|nr:ABC transporter ATP-binding protein [Bacillota bacterium]